MPKYSFIITKAIDLVARKLAGMDPETLARLTAALSEEAQMISDEFHCNGQNINVDMLAARLDGLIKRMKYELRNKGSDLSPNEFPIFNVSDNPSAPNPNPINHLYDQDYNEHYSTSSKQHQSIPWTSQQKNYQQPPTYMSIMNTNNPRITPYNTYTTDYYSVVYYQ